MVFHQCWTNPSVSWWWCDIFSHQSRIILSSYKKDGSCSWLIVRGFLYPVMSISFGNLVSAIGRGTITYCSNTLYRSVWRTPLYQGTSRPKWIDQHCPWLTFWTILVWSQPTWISSLPSAEGWCHLLLSTASHPRTMAHRCLHREWSLSIFPRFPIHGGPGRTGM